MRNRPLTNPDESLADLRIERRQGILRLLPTGEWNIGQSPRLDGLVRAVQPQGAREAEIDGSNISDLDSAGAWLLLRGKRALEGDGVKVSRFVLPERYTPLVQKMEDEHLAPPVTHAPHPRGAVYFLERVGRGTTHAFSQGYGILGFLGRVTVEAIEALLAPRRELPVPAFVRQIEETGLTAMPRWKP